MLSLDARSHPKCYVGLPTAGGHRRWL